MKDDMSTINFKTNTLQKFLPSDPDQCLEIGWQAACAQNTDLKGDSFARKMFEQGFHSAVAIIGLRNMRETV